MKLSMADGEVTVEGNVLTVRIELPADGKPSKSGKSVLLAQLNDRLQVNGERVVLNGTVYRPLPKAQ